MDMTKRTYALPAGTIAQFEELVRSGERSSVVSQLLEEYLARQKRDARRRDIVEGCRDMWDVYAETAREWRTTDDELHRAIE